MAKYNYQYSYRGEGDRLKSKHIVGGIIGIAGAVALGWYAYNNWGYITEQFDSLVNYLDNTSSPVSSSSPQSLSAGASTGSATTAGTLSNYTGFGAGQSWLSYVTAAASNYNVSPALILGLIEVESNGVVSAVNTTSGATGLMQLLPSTAAGMGYSLSSLSSPYQNIMAGTQYLAQMLSAAGGNVIQALEYYNAGPNANQATLQSSGVTGYANHVYNNFLTIKNQMAA